ncbi:hypothetical protein L3X38_005754 [Prunus dulcis]|uniref:Uncharacterized protein n=1 Tax=Prunus dulcis TaxID=3755 RepID=A0AAD5F4E4_PRUDU|nr:hypothetical protein L3X38_005754 [Prunus dulcis]
MSQIIKPGPKGIKPLSLTCLLVSRIRAAMIVFQQSRLFPRCDTCIPRLLLFIIAGLYSRTGLEGFERTLQRGAIHNYRSVTLGETARTHREKPPICFKIPHSPLVSSPI